jgi:hypothetical protein
MAFWSKRDYMADPFTEVHRLIQEALRELVWESVEHDLDVEYADESIASSWDVSETDTPTTLDEFLQALELIHDQFEWKLIPEPHPLPEQRKTPRLALRGKPKRAPEIIALDPVAAVCYAQTGQLHEWYKAGVLLGLDLFDTAGLVASSNDNTFSGSKGQRKPEDKLIAIRRRILEAVGMVVQKRAAGRA